jgi:hypothetical protein
MNRIVRRFAALAAIAALAFAQLATSAFACPAQTNAASWAHSATVQAMDGCDESANLNLCERHCDYGSSSVGYAAPAMPVLPVADLPWRIETVAAPVISRVVLERQHLLSRSPPPLTLFGVLRI